MQKLYLVSGSEISQYVGQDGGKRKLLLNGEDGGPFAIMMQMPPGVVKPHYHPTDQFQVIMEGMTTYPDHVLKPLDIHYTDSRTLYGPFVVPSTGMTHAVLRRRKVGIVFMEDPPSYGSKSSKEGRQLYGLASSTPWEELGDTRRKVTLGKDGEAPLIEVIEGRKGASIETGPAPFGEFLVFYKGTFSTEGRRVEGVSLRFAETKDPTPKIVCETDGATVIVARYDRPLLLQQAN